MVASDPDQEHICTMGSETLYTLYGVGNGYFCCYILSDESSRPFYSTIYGYNNSFGHNCYKKRRKNAIVEYLYSARGTNGKYTQLKGPKGNKTQLKGQKGNQYMQAAKRD